MKCQCGFPWGADPVRHAEICDNRRLAQIDHLANAVLYETPTAILSARRISLLGYDPTTTPRPQRGEAGR